MANFKFSPTLLHKKCEICKYFRIFLFEFRIFFVIFVAKWYWFVVIVNNHSERKTAERLQSMGMGETKLIRIGDKLYHQIHVTMEVDMDACVTEKTDRGCDIERIRLKKIPKVQLAKYGYVVLEKYS